MKTAIHVICTALILSIVISIGILGSVPPVDRDSLTHHLYVPKLYLKHGGIYEIPAVEFSYFPMNLDLLYTAALYFGSDILPKYLHFAFALLTAWLIFRYLKYRLNTLYAMFGVLLFLSIPIVVKLSITAYVDLGLIFFTLFSIIHLLKWVENDFQLKYLVISAIGCGLGLGTKYNGLITLFLLTLFVPFSYARLSSKGNNSFLKPLGYCAVYLSVSLIVFSPWMIRNIIWKQNPVYPLYDSWFHPEAPKPFSESAIDDSDSAPKRMGHFLIRKYVFQEPWWQTAMIPVRIFFEGKDDEPAHFDGKLSPLIFMLPFFAFLRIRNKAAPFHYEISTFLAFSVLFLLYAFVTTDMRIRYIAPIVPPLVVLSIIGLHNLLGLIREFTSRSGQIWAQAGVWTVVLALCPAGYLIDQFDKVKAVPYISGKIDRDSYITQFRPEYPAIRYANQHLPGTSKILAIFLGNRGYYFDRDVLFDMKLPVPANDAAGAGRTVEALLKRQGITHLLIRYDFFDRWIGTLTDNDREILARFFHTRTRLLFSSGGHGLFALEE
jgi:4-amino-4-deoxy-L-arabinose transferase-like glycosyltransferase